MTDDLPEPDAERPAIPPTRRRPPSQSDIHGISTIASVPGGRDRRPAPAPAGDRGDDQPRPDGA